MLRLSACKSPYRAPLTHCHLLPWLSRDPTGAEISVRGKDAALALLAQHKATVDSGVSFTEVASKNSDCGSAQDGGSLGFFGPGQMMAVRQECPMLCGAGL